MLGIMAIVPLGSIVKKGKKLQHHNISPVADSKNPLRLQDSHQVMPLMGSVPFEDIFFPNSLDKTSLVGYGCHHFPHGIPFGHQEQ